MATSPPTGGSPTSGGSTIQVYQTVPTSIAVHMIEDHQLEALTNVSKPISLAAAGAAAGSFLGLLPSFVAALRVLNTDKFGGEQATYIALEAVLLISAVYLSAVAYKGDRYARRLVANIRARTRHPI